MTEENYHIGNLVNPLIKELQEELKFELDSYEKITNTIKIVEKHMEKAFWLGFDAGRD